MVFAICIKGSLRPYANHYQPVSRTRTTLLTLLQENEESGWEVFFDKYSPLIYNIGCKTGLRPVEAEDVVQEVTLSVMKGVGRFEHDPESRKFKPWLLRIVRNCVANEFRKRDKAGLMDNHTLATTIEGWEVVGDSFDSLWEEEWQRNVLTLALNKVRSEASPREYQLFDLYVLQQLPVRQIAKKLNVSFTRIYVAKKRIGDRVQKAAKQIDKETELQLLNLQSVANEFS